MSRAHAKLGASNAHRWLACPGSVAIEAALPESAPGQAALDGTAAHELAELCLSARHDDSREYIGTKLPKSGYVVDDDMAGAVNVFLAECEKIMAQDKQHELYVEERVTLDKIASDMFGTADCLVYLPNTATVHVVDYKHGIGHFVDASGNPQLAFYALGAAWRFHNRAVSQVTVTIVQPRGAGASPVRSVTYSRADLFEWRQTLEQGRAAALAPNAPRVPGEWCKWCRGVRGACPEVAAKVSEAAATGFDAVPQASLTELGKRLAEVPILKAYIKQLEEHALSEAKAGRMPLGYKLVEGRGTREWVTGDDEVETVAMLAKHFPCGPFWKPQTVRTVADFEKEVGKAAFAKVADKLVKRVPGNATLVPETDKRKSVADSAADGF